MKYLKTYEKIKSRIKNEPGEWDYVIIKTNDTEHSERYNSFLENHILEISQIHGNYIYARPIFDDDEPEEIKNEFDRIQPFRMDKIKFYADNIEELKLKIATNKYNL